MATEEVHGAPLLESVERKKKGCWPGSGGRRGGLLAAEVRRQLWLAGPLIVSCLLQNGVQLISIMFVGHLGELALAGASIATSFTGVTGFSLQLGMASALDTLCGQAFGARQYRMLGIYKQRAMLVLTAVSFPIAILWCYTSQILVLCGQDAEIAMAAGDYARWMVPALFAFGLLKCHTRFLQMQNIVLPVVLICGVTVVIHTALCWVLIYKLGLGTRGAALCNGISYWINVALLASYIRFSSACTKTWTGFSKEIFCDLGSFFKLAAPSAVMVCMEWWSFEFIVLMSGLLPNPKLETSVLSISLNTGSLIYMVPFGLSAAISTRVSNELGAGHPLAAQLAIRVAASLAAAESVVISFLLILVRNIWGRAYSNEEEVVQYVARMLPVLALSNFFDSFKCVCSGIARGCGWQKIGACVNLGAYYLVGIPAAFLLAFVFHTGGVGLWFGLMCGTVVQFSLLLTVTLRADWEKEARMAEGRVAAGRSRLPFETVA